VRAGEPSAAGATAAALLAPLGLPTPRGGLARTADQAAGLFRELGGPVALKVESPDLLHKNDLGGVRLHLADEAAVRLAFAQILAEVAAHRPDARLEGVLVQEMATDGVELLLGARVDPDFGPLVVLGLGGLFVETLGDLALRLAPVSAAEVETMLEQLRGAPLLRGARGRPPADRAALLETVVRFSELAVGLPPGVAALEINPLLVRGAGRGLMMLDAKVEREGNEHA
jgi:succinyl-CoA synthetase beta subunit